jgi:hypothetical protein
MLILADSTAALLPRGQYELTRVGSVFATPDNNEVIQALIEGRLKDCLEESRQSYCVAIRVTPPRSLHAAAK